MKRFTIEIHWRAFRWNLSGQARSGCDLIEAIADHFPPTAKIMVSVQK